MQRGRNTQSRGLFAMSAPDKSFHELNRKELDRMGFDQVALLFKTDCIPNRLWSDARQWLVEKELERDRLREHRAIEQEQLARSSKTATWIGAYAAVAAAVLALAGIVATLFYH